MTNRRAPRIAERRASCGGRRPTRAVDNIGRIAGPLPRDLILAIVAIKIEAAAVNARLDVITRRDRAGDHAPPARRCSTGASPTSSRVDVFQTGSGTSTNMNVNEVLAKRASEISGLGVHPNDHVNASQSSNDVFPSAIRDRRPAAGAAKPVAGARRGCTSSSTSSASDARRHRQARPHAPDGRGADDVRPGGRVAGRVRSSWPLPRIDVVVRAAARAGARRHRSRHRSQRPADVRRRDRRSARRVASTCRLREAVDHFESQGGQEALGDLSGACRTAALTLNKIAGDLRLLGSGPASGLGEVSVPDLQAGSSIMPGKVNPIVLEVVQQIAAQVVGNDAAVTFATTNATLAAHDGDAGDGAQPAVEHRPLCQGRGPARRQGDRHCSRSTVNGCASTPFGHHRWSPRWRPTSATTVPP